MQKRHLSPLEQFCPPIKIVPPLEKFLQTAVVEWHFINVRLRLRRYRSVEIRLGKKVM